MPSVGFGVGGPSVVKRWPMRAGYCKMVAGDLFATSGRSTTRRRKTVVGDRFAAKRKETPTGDRRPFYKNRMVNGKTRKEILKVPNQGKNCNDKSKKGTAKM